MVTDSITRQWPRLGMMQNAPGTKEPIKHFLFYLYSRNKNKGVIPKRYVPKSNAYK
jgi:hypothetical protein